MLIINFLDQFRGDIDEVLSTLDIFGAQHERQCGQLTANIRSQLAARAGQLQQLAQAVGQVVAAQTLSLTTLSDLSTAQQASDSEWLTSYSGLCDTTAAEQTQLSRELSEARLGPLLNALNTSLDIQSQELTALQETIRVDFAAMVATFNTFTVDLVDRMTTVRGAVDSFATETATAMADLARENAAIQASEAGFKVILEDMMAKYLVHLSQVTASTAAMSSATHSCGRLAGRLVETVQKAAEAAEASQVAMEARTEEQQSKAVTKWSNGVRSCEETISSVRSTSSTIAQTVSDYVAESGARLGRFEAETKDRVEKARVASAAYVEQVGGRTAEAVARLEADAAAVEGGIQKNVQSDKQVWYRY